MTKWKQDGRVRGNRTGCMYKLDERHTGAYSNTLFKFCIRLQISLIKNFSEVLQIKKLKN